MPSTISDANAVLDKKPITALQFPLTDEQKHQIADRLAKAPDTRAKENLNTLHVTELLPMNVPMQVFPNDLTQQIPNVARYKYVKLADRVLIVDPVFASIVGEIGR